MAPENISKRLSTQEDCSNGGKARALALSSERRKEIATKASHARNCLKNTPKATHFGKLNFGPIEISCAVLEDGRSVITEGSIFKLFGRSVGGRKKVGGGQLPRFLSANNLQEYIPESLRGVSLSFDISMPHGGKAYAYEAEKVPQILKVYLDARRAGILTPSQIPFVMTAEIILLALAQTGIVSLIHEATGYQNQRENNELQKLFSKFIAKELQPWVKRFPDAFFSHLKRMYGLDEMKKAPRFVGHLINRWIYHELSPEIHEELKRLNPVQESGQRKYPHHRLLTQDVGCPALDKQILKVTTLMSVADSREDLEKLLERSKSKDEKKL